MVDASGATAGAGPMQAPAAQAYDPYGQLIRMLLPRCGSIAVYGASRELLWCSDGYQRPDLHDVLEVRSAETVEALSNRGTTCAVGDGGSAFLYALRGKQGRILGTVVVELGADQGGQTQDSMVSGLLRPVLDCLESRMELEQSAADGTEGKGYDDGVDLLLAVDQHSDGPNDALEHLVEQSVEYLGCALGVLVIPEKSLTICRAGAGAQNKQETALLSRAQKHLLAWVQLKNRPVVVNQISPEIHANIPPYKILSCPVRDPEKGVAGLFGLFRSADAPDFELRDSRILEFMSRKAVNLLHSQYDRLTGVLSRQAFERCVQRALDGPTPQSGHALLHIDIDRLNEVNDAFGFQAGDEVIQRLVAVMRTESGPGHTVGRIGGDRFAVLIPGKSSAQAEHIAEHLRETVGRLGYMNGERSVAVSISVGVAVCTTVGRVAAHALAAADLACKRAKDRGRNRVEVYREDGATMTQRHTDVYAFSRLQEALKGNRFQLDAQPIHGLAVGDQVLGYEMLLRLLNEDGKRVAPEKFMCALERYHLTPALDRWVLRSTLDVLRDNSPQLPPGLTFMINVSAQSVANDDFRGFVLGQLRDSHMHAERCCVEIKESAVGNYLREAEAFVRELTELGCAVALDNFGSGLSSLAHLKTLPVGFLKIDGGFVRRILQDPLAESMVIAVAQAAKALGIKTIAAHVETEPVASRLKDLGVDYGQGYYFARPRALDQVIRELSSRERPAQASVS